MKVYKWCTVKSIASSAVVVSVILIIILTRLSSIAQISSRYTSPSATIYEHTLHNRYKTADSLIRYYSQSSHNDLSLRIAVINYYWWKYISSENNATYARMIKSLAEPDKSKILLNTDKNYLEHLFVSVSSIAYNARLDLSDKSYYSALTALADYNANIKETFGKETQYSAFFLTSGLYYYFHAHASEKIPFFNTIAGNGRKYTKSEGLILLKKASLQNDLVIHTEARYFLMKIASEIESDYTTAIYYIQMLCNEYPENLLFRYHKIKIHLERGEMDAVKKEVTIFKNAVSNNAELSEEEKQYFRELITKELAKKRTIRKHT